MKHFISDHAPMDDHNKIIGQAYCTIESNEEYLWEPDNKYEGLRSNRMYRFIAGIVKILLLLAGILILSSVIMFLVWGKVGERGILKNLTMVSLLSGVCAFGLAILFAVAGACMESYRAGEDKIIQDDRRRRTLLLQNGNIAVIYKSCGRLSQIPTRFFDWNEAKEVDVPFSRIFLISKVYSICKKDGRIIASVKCLEYLMIHPYVNEYEGDSVEHYFRYYTKKVRETIGWSDKMLNAEKLCFALQSLKIR